jgi:hypothetical protein
VYSDHSKHQSVVRVDGESHFPGVAGRVLYYSGAAEDPEAAIDVMGGDHTYAYRGQGWPNMNGPRLRPDPLRPWLDMDARRLPHWERGDVPRGAPTALSDVPGAQIEFDHALRTVAFVRGAHPYVVVLDDIRQDAAARAYTWSLNMPGDVYGNDSYALAGTRATLHDPEDATRHLHVEMISSAGAGAFTTSEQRDESGEGVSVTHKLEFETQTTGERFRAILYPYRDGAPMPVVAGDADAFTVTLDGETTTFSTQTDARGRMTGVTITRDGEALVERSAVLYD